MAAKYDAITLSITWTATLIVTNQDVDTVMPQTSAPTEGVSLSAINGLAQWLNDGGMPGVEGQAHYVVTHAGTGPGDPNETDIYYPFKLIVQAPGDPGPVPESDEDQYFVKVGSFTGFPGFGGFGAVPGGSVLIDGDLSADVTITLTNIFMRASSTDDTPSERGFLWFGDRSFSESWFADEDSTITVTAVGPSGSLSVSGPTGFVAGEFEIGTNVQMFMSINANRFPVADTELGIVAIPEWDGIAVGLDNLSLYKPGDAGSILDPINAPGWSREEDGADRARVSDIGGAAIWAEGSHTAGAAWSGVLQAPFQVTFEPRDGKFGYH